MEQIRTALVEEQIGSQRAGKHAKWLHELMTKGAASANTARCMDMEEEDQGCINVIQGDGIDDAAE
jgi:hypothetical protein